MKGTGLSNLSISSNVFNEIGLFFNELEEVIRHPAFDVSLTVLKDVRLLVVLDFADTESHVSSA